MPNIFISYARRDFHTARRLRARLQAEGIVDIFLDVDPVEGLKPGSFWARELETKVRASKVLLCLVSQNWLESKWCRQEFQLGLGKRGWLSGRKRGPAVIPMLLEGTERPDVQQAGVPGLDALNGRNLRTSLNLEDGEDPEALSEAQRALLDDIWGWLEALLEAEGVRPTRPPYVQGRPPYPGLVALKEDDAAVFFGRETFLDTAADRILQMRRARRSNFMTILGASGAGKSSLLRAGLIPRLRYDEESFFCLPLVRPGGKPISGNDEGLAASLHNAFRFQDKYPRLKGLASRNRGDMQRAIRGRAEAVEEILLDLQTGVSPLDSRGEIVNPVTLVLPIDQGEELLAADAEDAGSAGMGEIAQFNRLIRDLLERRRVNLVVVMAVRSDSFPRLQSHADLGGIEKETLDLPPLPHGAYRAVIEGPARVARLDLEPALVDRLLADVSGQDALPLLAFVLGRLWNEREQKPGDQKDRLSLADYERIGAVSGALDKVIDRALGKGFDRALLRKTFIPHLATVAEQNGAFLRRIAHPDELPAAAKGMVDKLVDEARILVRRDDARIEVAHEAVLREWRLLTGWLSEARGALWHLRQAEDTAREWGKNRAALVAAHGEAGAEVVEFDRATLWTQAGMDDVWQAIDKVGQQRGEISLTMSAFLRPEVLRLIDELACDLTRGEGDKAIAVVDHPRRALIGERLAALGDPRPGISLLRLDRIERILANGPVDQRQQRQFAALQERQVEDGKLRCEGLPDIAWCFVPANPDGVELRLEVDDNGKPKAETVNQKIPEPFWISKYPVMLDQFNVFAGTPRIYHDDRWWEGMENAEPRKMREAREQSGAINRPAQYINWYQAIAYCRWLTAQYQRLGLLPDAASAKIGLPSEAQWVQAATGGNANYNYPWGAGWDPTRTCNQGRADDAPGLRGINQFVAAGLYPHGASPVGAMDMSGNLYEWCLNTFDDIGNADLGGEAKRTTRGGSYYTFAQAGAVEDALSVHGRLADNPLGLNPAGARIAAGIRLVATGVDAFSPEVYVEDNANAGRPG